MSDLVESIRGEYVRYKALAEAALLQIQDDELAASPAADGNSATVICWHLAGNLKSRFTDFLTADGEKPWRNREEEFDERTVTREQLMAKWNDGWSALFGALDGVTDAQLHDSVTIRGQSLRVHEALNRSVAHAAYHVGQIVLLAKSFRGAGWKSLSIPRGGSAAYNQHPGSEKPAAHADALTRKDRR